MLKSSEDGGIIGGLLFSLFTHLMENLLGMERASFTICKHSDDISEWSGPHLCTGEILLPFIFPTQETRFDEWGAGEDSKR